MTDSLSPDAPDTDPTEVDDFSVDMDTTDAVEMGPADAGEHRLLILNAEPRKGEGKNGPWRAFNLQIDVPDDDSAKYFYHMEFLPHPSMEGKRMSYALSDLKVFKEALGFDPNESFSASDLIGREAWGLLGIDDDPKYGVRNVLKKWLTGAEGDDNIPGL